MSIDELEENKQQNLDINDWIEVDQEINDYSDFEDTLIEI